MMYVTQLEDNCGSVRHMVMSWIFISVYWRALVGDVNPL